MVGAVTAAVAAVASVGIAAYGMSQQAGVQGQQQQIANSQLGIQEQQMQMEQGLFNQQQPYRDQLHALVESPNQVTNLPGYQFNKQQGEESVARQFAGNPSGAEGVALTKFGSDYSQGVYQQQVAMLSSLSGLTTPASTFASGSNPVGAGSNLNTGQNQSFNELMQVLSQTGATAKMFGPGGQFNSAGTPGSGSTAGGVA